MPSVLLWAYSAEKSFLILQIRNDCGHSGFAFSRGGVVVPSVCFTPWSGVRIPLTTAPASLPCTPLFVAMRHLPPTGGSLCSLAAVSSAAIPVRVKLKIPRANAAAATTLDIPSRWDLQQRRPRPVADAGRSCWGSGQQDARAAQGTRGCWEPQPGALNNSPTGALVAVLRTAALFDSRAGQIKNPPSECSGSHHIRHSYRMGPAG